MSCAAEASCVPPRPVPATMLDPLSNSNSTAPSATYAAGFAAAQNDTKRLSQTHVLLGYVRLGWVAALLVLGWFALERHAIRWEWMLLPAAGFALTGRRHSRVLKARARSVRAERFFEHGLARLEGRWAGLQPRSPRPDAENSLYATDLDLFDAGGLFELLCTARTTLGEDTLARWLLHPAALDEVAARQQAVADSGSRIALREALARCLGPDLVALDGAALAAWGEARDRPLPELLRWFSPVLALLTVAAGLWWLSGHSVVLLIPMLVVNGGLTFLLQQRYKPLFAQAQETSRQLTLLAELMRVLEHEAFTAPALRDAQAKLLASSQPASTALRGFAGLAGAIEQRGNYVIRILDVPLLYSVQLALLVQRWRQAHGTQMRPWLEALGELEALLSLSTYHYEHPADCFPSLSPTAPVFAAEGLGHPLLKETACVRNDVRLEKQTRLLLISGSNMSGKSTLLRSVGTAAVMAMAGAPVRARHLCIGSLHVAASIQVNDSLQGGRSRFYAEILRLRAICDLARTQPTVLFLLDELLAGTNSSDRLAGATGIVRALLETGALGLLSTHDLALTSIDGPVADAIRNAHFEDMIVDGELRFDYTLREGVVERSNGLALMRLIGLDV